jgi:phage virion morphogenesis protein
VSYTAPLDAWLQALIASTKPEARRQLARRVAQALRQSQIDRNRAQQNPDGTPYEPRKPQPAGLREKKGRLRRRMFARMATKHMRATATGSAATVEIAGRAARIARVHQFGLEDTVNRRGLRVRYPIREILGFSKNDIDAITGTVLHHIDPR